MTDLARRLYDRAMEERAWRARWAEANPRAVAPHRTHAKANSYVAECDDPMVYVRTSDLIALCAPLLDEPVPVDPNQPELFTTENA